MRLYEITDEIRAVGMRLSESIQDDGQIPADLADQLDGLELETVNPV